MRLSLIYILRSLTIFPNTICEVSHKTVSLLQVGHMYIFRLIKCCEKVFISKK